MRIVISVINYKWLKNMNCKLIEFSGILLVESMIQKMLNYALDENKVALILPEAIAFCPLCEVQDLMETLPKKFKAELQEVISLYSSCVKRNGWGNSQTLDSLLLSANLWSYEDGKLTERSLEEFIKKIGTNRSGRPKNKKRVA